MANKYITTPKGVFMYPALQKASLKYGSETEKEYKVKLVLSPENAAKFDEQLADIVLQGMEGYRKKFEKEATEGATGKAKKAAKDALERMVAVFPGSDQVDEDGNETGYREYNFKMPEEISYINKKTNERDTFKPKPVIVDGLGQRITKELSIGNGTVGKISFEPSPYFSPAKSAQDNPVCGVSLRLKGVQIIKLEQYGNNEDLGFEEVEDGYEFSEEDVVETQETSSEDIGETDDF